MWRAAARVSARRLGPGLLLGILLQLDGTARELFEFPGLCASPVAGVNVACHGLSGHALSSIAP